MYFRIGSMYIFPVENGDIPASYVSLPEGKQVEMWRSKMASNHGDRKSPK